VHIVTKILVVFAAVLSLLLAALTMAYASNADAIKSSYSASENARVAAQLSASMSEQNSAERHAKDQAALKSLQNDLAAKDSENASLRAENSRLTSEVEVARAAEATASNQQKSIIATIDTQTNLLKKYAEEVAELRNQLLESSKKEIELVDRINDLEAAREVLEQNLRAVKEQLEETKLSLQQAQSGGTATAGAPTIARELAGPVVRARVSEVMSTPAGDMVVISEGANRGIREATKMHIVRGAQYIGSIEISTVEPTQAVGKVTFISGDSRVQKDDTVLSRLQ